MITLQSNIALKNLEVASLLRFADERYILPFNPLAGPLPVIPGNRPMPDPVPPMRGF